MFSNATVALLGGLGVGAWVYNRAYHTNGGVAKNSLILGGAAGGGTFLLVLTLMSIFLK